MNCARLIFQCCESLEQENPGVLCAVWATFALVSRTVVYEVDAPLSSSPGCSRPAGVLRNAIRRLDAGSLPTPPRPPAGAAAGQVADAMAIAASHPTWMVERWLRQFGEAPTVALTRWNNRYI